MKTIPKSARHTGSTRTGAAPALPDNAKPFNVGLNYSEAGNEGEHGPHDDDASSGASPLSEEQLAFYQARLESGYYRSPDVINKIARRLADDLFPQKKQE